MNTKMKETISMDNTVSGIETMPISAVNPIIYKKQEKIFAFLTLAFGYLFLKFLVSGCLNLGATLFFTAFIVAAFVLVKSLGIRQFSNSVTYLITAFVFSLYFTLSANFFLKYLTLHLVIILICLWAFSLNNENYKGAEDNFCSVLLRSLISEPFMNFGKCSGAISQTNKDSKKTNSIKFIIFGLLLAIPVTALIIFLLSSADDNFAKLTNSIFDNIGEKILVNGFQICVGIPIAFYLFGMMFSAINSSAMKSESSTYKNVSMKYRFVNHTLIISSVIPLCVVYVTFFFCQLSYFISAFMGKLPQQFSYAEYARKGFFELFAVSLINLFIIIVINLICKNKDNDINRPASVKFFTGLISVFTLILIATAVSKMVMYIGEYGLTSLRVYTTWFMILLIILFTLIIIRQFKKVNIAKIGSIAFIVMFFMLTFLNTDNLIVKYNYWAYANNRIVEFDTSIFNDTSPDAVYEAINIKNSGNSDIKKSAEYFIEDNSYYFGDFRTFNLSTYMCKSNK